MRPIQKHLGSALVALFGVCSSGQALAQPDPAPPPPAPAEPTPPTQPAAPETPPAAATEEAAPKGSYAEMARATPGYTDARTGPSGLEQRLTERAVIPVVRVGFVAAGSGQYKEECDGIGCSAVTLDEIDYNEKSGLVIGADLLFRVIPKLRLGFGLNYIPNPKIEQDEDGNSEEFESGNELDAFAVVEGVFPVSETVGLLVRGFGGVTVMFPGSDHQDLIDINKVACESTGANCENSEGPFVGPTFGLGFGAVFLVGSIGLRAEIWGQSINQPLIRQTVGSGGLESDLKAKLVGSRGMFFVGAEF